ncbi:hypothetical protein NXF25_008529 [Crotalus adamanteus]|uniref:Uncharacterized protein n=1 Tax=Crotalus adamanteus TaxID=8729 RepID=A0AAW1BNZ9_CROAD
MSLLQALGPVQTWLGQELEKCGIDAMIYTRYVLSLLLHDNYDYDLQEQENDIFLGWEKGAYKKWGKSKKKCSDLTLEEMKKQAAVQCLRSASDESSGIETLVEELCSRLKDLQSEQEEKISKRLEDSLPSEIDLSPAAKDQVEMYYEAFPPLSQKPVCLQEIMTVICGAGRTQYRAIRISPRTHFRPISASELSPCGGSESDFESEKDEGTSLVSAQAESFDDPQADLKPLEEDAEKEGHYYGKLELESGKFFPTLKKCGMEKSAQTSLDSQEESSGILLVENESSCLECGMKDVQDTMAVKNSEASCTVVEPQEEEDKSCSCKESSSMQLKEFPVLSNDLQKISYNQAKQCWWEKALYTPLFPTSQYEDPLQVLCFWTPGMHVHQEPHCCNWGLKDKAPHIESEMVDVGTEQLLDKEFRCDSLHLTSNQADIQHTQKKGYSSHSLSCRQQGKSTASAAAKCCTNIKRENSDEEFTDMKELLHSEEHLQDFNMISSMHEARA